MSHSKHMVDIRKPYSGLSRSLVIAIDVGTTFSGVSYAILEPGEIPKIHGVTRFPGQEHVAGNSKIPSIIYYDKYGTVKAAGAEVDNTSVVAQAEDEGWIKAELFKLRLRPRTMQLNMNGMRLSPLPKRKTPVHVFGDFLIYMYRCTRSFICDTHANGKTLWNSVERDIQLILSHPNGWEGPQQTRMRNAAVYGKLVPDTDAGRARIRFVTEGEASLHACVLSGLASEVLSNPSKHGFLIADAGGGTLDISAYAVKGTSPLTIEEIAPPDCIFAGSVFVSRRAREFLEDKLRNSKYGTPDSVEHITRKFDETTKRLFRDRNELQFIPFGSPLDKDPAVGIRSGQLRLSGNEVANLFEPSVDAAVNAIKRQIDASRGLIRSVFLVGGYAASPWLFQQLSERLAPLHVAVSRPDTQTSKAVADGAIGFYCDHHVSARMSKFMYGVEFLRTIDPNDPDHIARKERLCELPSGPKLLPDAFDCILARGVKVKESTVFTRKYCTELTNLSMLSVFEVEVWCFRGGDKIPKWINRQDEKFSTLCVVQADLSLLNGSAEPKIGTNGKKYWAIVFSVEIHFGLTEFNARIKWMDKGQVKYGPAVIVYNEHGHRIEDEDLDVYPEEDQSYQTPRSDRRGGDGVVSRPRTPINQYPPPAAVSGGRRESAFGQLEPIRIEKSSSRGYTPSVAPSIAPSTSYRSTNDRSMYSGSDSERKKGKDREEKFDDKTSITPVDNTMYSAAYGQSPISRGASNAASDSYSTAWGGVPAMTSSQSPTIRPPNSRSVSFYDSQPPSAVEQHTMNQDWGGPPKSAVDEHHQSYNWDNPSPQRSPHVAQLNNILDRPRSPFPPTHPDLAMTETKPKSAFGDPPPPVFGNDPPPMFGDNGPAAYTGETAEVSAVGASAALFGDPPASVFGGNVGGETGVSDSWGGFGAATTPVTTPGKKGKKKTSGIGTPVSGLASRTSPATGPKSPLADGASGGLLGSKAPSPYDKGKRLSPLNPASQMNNDQVTEANHDNWAFDTGHQGGTSGWGAVNLDEPLKPPSRAPSPVTPAPHVEPPVQQVLEEPETGVMTGKKKKKKGGVAGAANVFASGTDNERRKQEEKEAQKDSLAKEEQGRQEPNDEEKELQRSEYNGAHQSSFGNPTSLFSGGLSSSLSLNPPDKPWLAADTGGGDGSWGGWGSSPKKKGTLGEITDVSTQQPSTGWGFGSGYGSSLEAHAGGGAASTNPTALFDFASSGPNLGFNIGNNPSRSVSPAPGATEDASNRQNPFGHVAEGVSAGEVAGGLEGGPEDETVGDDIIGKKKKKKGKKGGVEAIADEIPITPAAEDAATEVPVVPEPEEEFNPVAVLSKKKKKKK